MDSSKPAMACIAILPYGSLSTSIGTSDPTAIRASHDKHEKRWILNTVHKMWFVVIYVIVLSPTTL
uniref:Uncharacterized protein n=1 Tax=Magallana gigas TaxID=29159 RepID=K1QK58_MAGGI